MNPADHTPSTAPLPPELAALDFEPFAGPDAEAERETCDLLIALTHREISLRIDLARALRDANEAEAEYLAADTERDRREWRERARVAEHAAMRASLDLHRVLLDRGAAMRSFSARHQPSW